MSTEVITRIAPSPTGNLHLGTVRTAVYNQIFAARHGGKFLFRLEDTDRERSKEEFTQEIIDGFNWLGITWHGDMVLQSAKENVHSQYIEKLIAENKAYRCYATKEELDEMRTQQRANKEAEGYDNRGRNLSAEQIAGYEKEGRSAVVRLNLGEPRDIKWNDLIRGEMKVNSKDLGGDMVIQKANGQVLYNFAVVVDDAEMGVNHVFRGEDHLTNTAKQILIYEALGFEVPSFGHLPLIFTKDKQKLSKRKHGDIAGVEKYKNEGYLPEALANYLISTSYTPLPEHDLDGDGLFTLDEISKTFRIEGVSKSPAIYDLQKLNWYNREYIKKLSLDELKNYLEPYLNFKAEQLAVSEIASESAWDLMLENVRNNLDKFSDINENISYFFREETVDEKLQSFCSEAKDLLAKLLEDIETLDFSQPNEIKEHINKLGADFSLSGKKLFWPVRIAVSFRSHGPDLGLVFALLGKDKVRQRLQSVLEN